MASLARARARNLAEPHCETRMDDQSLEFHRKVYDAYHALAAREPERVKLVDGRVGIAGAAAVLFAVNVTAVLPATPANIGVFQAACVAVLAGAYHVSTPDALAYGIVLQVVEIATAVLMGVPALINEGLSWKDVRLRTMSGAPVKLSPLPAGARTSVAKGVPSKG